MIFHYFFCQNTSVPSVYVKAVTLDKLQKYNRIPYGAESVFLSYSFDTFCLLRPHVFCKASTELAKENTVLVSEFLAHLSRRLIGELIVHRSSRRPSVRACVSASVC